MSVHRRFSGAAAGLTIPAGSGLFPPALTGAGPDRESLRGVGRVRYPARTAAVSGFCSATRSPGRMTAGS